MKNDLRRLCSVRTGDHTREADRDLTDDADSDAISGAGVCGIHIVKPWADG